jgi:hypothetical protein
MKISLAASLSSAAGLSVTVFGGFVSLVVICRSLAAIGAMFQAIESLAHLSMPSKYPREANSYWAISFVQ